MIGSTVKVNPLIMEDGSWIGVIEAGDGIILPKTTIKEL